MTDSFDSPLNGLHIAAPCDMDWNNMTGDEQKRFCGDCQLHVYNLSGMTTVEAEILLETKRDKGAERLCVRYFKRADGTVLTQDCPVGLKKVYARKHRRIKLAAAVATVTLVTIVGVLSTNVSAQESLPPGVAVAGGIRLQPQSPVTQPNDGIDKPTRVPCGTLIDSVKPTDASVPAEIMGEMPAYPVVQPPKGQELKGDIALPLDKTLPKVPENPTLNPSQTEPIQPLMGIMAPPPSLSPKAVEEAKGTSSAPGGEPEVMGQLQIDENKTDKKKVQKSDEAPTRHVLMGKIAVPPRVPKDFPVEPPKEVKPLKLELNPPKNVPTVKPPKGSGTIQPKLPNKWF